MKRFWAFLLLYVPIAAGQVISGRYIVELASQPVAAYAAQNARRETVSQHRLGIQAEQQRVRKELESRGAEVWSSADTVANALMVRIPDEKAALLRSIPGVLRVHPVQQVKMLLDHALPLHHVPAAWSLIGGQDQAGAGIKIGIIDSGIDDTHPAFQDPGLQVPAGFPLVNQDSDLAYTNNKIIVARNYVDDPQSTARDTFGHGTAVAMAAAGLTNTTPFGTITGVAPKAFLGSYKTGDGSSTTDIIVKAFDDAAKDGMDIINLSSGSALAPRPNDDIVARAVERASAMGILVIVAAGNIGNANFDDAGNGGFNPGTVSSPATAPSAIAVGSTPNDRFFLSPAVFLDGQPAYRATPGLGSENNDPIIGTAVDVSTLDSSGLACQEFPADSLSGRIALILRGNCFFEVKLNNAQKAGAIAAIIYTHADSPNLDFAINPGQATLPVLAISNDSGLNLKSRLKDKPSTSVEMRFKVSTFPDDPNQVSDFSGRGPGPDNSIKPDLVAVGESILTATETTNERSPLFNSSGYSLDEGTSFSTALVSGAAAVVKAFRPGFTAEQYRSLVINSARPTLKNGDSAPVQGAGAGTLNVEAAIRNTATVSPSSLSFGISPTGSDLSRNLTISNVGTAADTYLVSVVPMGSGPAPAVSSSTFQIAPGASQTLSVSLPDAGLAPGEYQGIIQIQGTQTDVATRIPYWFATPTGTPDLITVLVAPSSAAVNAPVKIYFRITDTAGTSMLNVEPTVTALAGGGRVISVDKVDDRYPGVFLAQARMGAARVQNVFRIQIGDLRRDVTVTAGTSTTNP